MVNGMTLNETLKTIKSMPGMTAIYTEFKEFRIRRIGYPEADYFTTSKEDALSSAIYMRDWRPEEE